MRKITVDANAPLFRIDLKELYEFRWVFSMLILRDIKLRYKQTMLGITWVLLQPLFTVLLFTIIFGRFMGVETDGIPYSVFALCGLLPWLFFSQAIGRASICLVGDRKLITKVYFPRMFIPLSAIFGVSIDFLITLCMTFLLMAVKGVALSGNLLFLPVCTLLLYAFSSGMGLLFSAFNVYYRDLKHTLPFVLQLWMYASPLVYSASIVPEKFRLLYSLNPIAGIVDAFRWTLLGVGPFPMVSFISSVAVTLAVLVSGVVTFRKIEHYFADII